MRITQYALLVATRAYLLAFLMALSGAGEAAGSVGGFIVKDGSPAAQIVIAEKPARMTRLAAAELQSLVEKISGAKLTIATEPSPDHASIFVGISPHTERLGIRTDDLRHGAFRAVSGPGWLALVGPDKDFEPVEPFIKSRKASERQRVHKKWDAIAGDMFHTPFMTLYGDYYQKLDVWDHDDKGTINAVYDLVRGWGARWYFPGELGEILPKLATLKIPDGERTVRPDFKLRSFRYFWAREQMPEDEILWNFRMGVNAGRDILGLAQAGHGMKFVHMREDFQKENPRLFAVGAGAKSTQEGGTGRACLSSEEMLAKHLKFIRAVFDHYGEPMISIDLPDGYGSICEHEECKSQATPRRGFQGRMSDYVWKYMNRVAAAVYESHPDRRVSGLAYSGYQLPPLEIEQMSPNLALIECRWRSNFGNRKMRDRFREIREHWLKKLPSKEYFIWDYYLHARPKSPTAGLPAYFPRLIAEDLGSLKGVSGGDLIEVYRHPHHLDHGFSWHDFAIAHLNLYVTSRFWWDAGLDIDEMLEEYYTLFYGPAREPMKEFIEYSEQNYTRMSRDVKSIDRALELIKDAQAAVEPDSVYGRRIAMAAQYMEQMQPLREKLVQGRQGPELAIPDRGANEVQLDGKADESFWKEVPVFPLVDIAEGGDAKTPTTVRMAWGDNNTLYLHIECVEPDLPGMRDVATENDDTVIWEGDNVEVFLETPVSSFYQIAVSPSGRLLDVDRVGGIRTSWTSEAKAAAARGEGSWSVELEIPAAGESAGELYPDEGVAGDKPTRDAPWYLNVGRMRSRNGQKEMSGLAKARRLQDVFSFGRLYVDEQ